MMNIYFLLGILLVPDWELDGAQRPCPFPRCCTLEILNFSRIINPPRTGLQSSLKHSISGMPTNVLNPVGSIIEDKNNNNLSSSSNDGNSVAVLRDGHGVQISTQESLKKLLPGRNPPAGDDKFKISAIHSEPSFNELLPDAHGIDWEYPRNSISPPWNLTTQNDFFHLIERIKAEVKKQSTVLSRNIPMRKLISYMIHILKMDCMAPTVWMACEKLLLRARFLLKLLFENVNENSSLWKSYFWRSQNVSKATNITTGSSRNLEQPLDMTEKQRNPEQEFRKIILLFVSVAAILVVILDIICLLERSADKDRTFLVRRKKPLPDEELGSPLVEKPPSLEGQPLDERQKMVDKLHYEDSSGAEEIYSWGRRPSSSAHTPEKPPSEPTLELLIPPIPPPPLLSPPSSVQKPSVKTGSEATGGTSKATSPKPTSLAADGDYELC